MRVIAGQYRRYKLYSPKGDKIRPTSDKIKETLFNMLGDLVYDSVFLDLFAGTGQMGIEALSREAKMAIFVDIDRASVNLIKENLAHIGIGEEAKVIIGPAQGGIRKADAYKPDIIFMDPPYSKGLYQSVFEAIRDMESLTEDTLIIAEAAIDEDFSFLDKMGFYIEKEKNYKSSKHVFVKMN